LAEAADNTPLPEDRKVPHELKRRQDRLTLIAQAKQDIQARAKARYAQEPAEYDEKWVKREQHLRETGKNMGGKAPQAPSEEPQAKDQVSLTDAESCIMPTYQGFQQAYNAQASVDIPPPDCGPSCQPTRQRQTRNRTGFRQTQAIPGLLGNH
jgi:hypothetical protein